MQRLNCGFLSLGLAACVMAFAGCNGPTVDTEPVTGVVTLDGEPVEGATVTFVPVDPTKGVSAAGRTDAQGVYKLTAMVTGEEQAVAEAGTKPGEYYVGVRKAIPSQYVGADEAEEQGIEATELKPGESPKTDFVVPRKYRIPKESGLQVTVKEGENDIPLELTSN